MRILTEQSPKMLRLGDVVVLPQGTLVAVTEAYRDRNRAGHPLTYTLTATSGQSKSLDPSDERVTPLTIMRPAWGDVAPLSTLAEVTWPRSVYRIPTYPDPSRAAEALSRLAGI